MTPGDGWPGQCDLPVRGCLLIADPAGEHVDQTPLELTDPSRPEEREGKQQKDIERDDEQDAKHSWPETRE
jgi:hypothetical protein